MICCAHRCLQVVGRTKVQLQANSVKERHQETFSKRAKEGDWGPRQHHGHGAMGLATTPTIQTKPGEPPMLDTKIYPLNKHEHTCSQRDHHARAPAQRKSRRTIGYLSSSTPWQTQKYRHAQSVETDTHVDRETTTPWQSPCPAHLSSKRAIGHLSSLRPLQTQKYIDSQKQTHMP